MKNINIIGCGLMGLQIAGLFSIMGYGVNIWNRSPVNLNNIVRQKKIISKLLKTNDLNGDIILVKDFEKLKNLITIESLAEDLIIKKDYISKLEKKITKEIFTNSSSIKTKDLSEKLNLLHFFNPIYLRIIEYNHVKKLSEEAESMFFDLKKMNFDLIKVSNFTGYAFNKILFAEISNFFLLIEKEKIRKDEILRIFKKINHNLDVLNTIDLIGIDISIKIFENLNKEYNFYIPQILYSCREKNILGKKNKTSIKKIFESGIYPKHNES